MAATIWQKAAFFSNNHRGGDMPVLAKWAYDAGFRVIIPLLQQGTARVDMAGQPVPVDYIKMLKDKGHLVVGYGSLFAKSTVEAEREADVSVQLIDLYDLDGWIANPEDNYKYSQQSGFCAPCFMASDAYVDRFRAGYPKPFPLGVSSFAHFSMHDLHWAAWLNQGDARALPQAYSNQFGPLYRARPTFDSCIDVGQPWNPMIHPTTGKVIPGFPLSYWHPTLGNWGPGGGVRSEWNDVVEGARKNVMELIECKMMTPYGPHFWGFSVYDLEHQISSSIRIYGEAIRYYDLAKLA